MKTKKEKRSKNARTLDMYVRLCEGKIIHIAEEAEKFGVDERSVQRDIEDIRAFLADQTAAAADRKSIVYDRAEGGLVMKGLEKSVMTNSEILAVSKILLESRAFTKKELNGILNKLIERCVPQQNMKIVSDLIANEKYHYVELHHKTSILDRIWKLGENIREQDILEIKYQKPETDEQPQKEEKTRIIEPVGILFAEYYFYLIAYVDVLDQTKYVHKYDYPAIFRIDRISCIRRTEEKFRIPYASRLEEGEFRKRVQFMYAGELTKIRFRYYGNNPEPIFDRIPTAKITRQEETGTVFEAEVYGKGIIMWILSQGAQIEVIGPDSVRTEMKQVISDMLARYQENPDT